MAWFVYLLGSSYMFCVLQVVSLNVLLHQICEIQHLLRKFY